MLHTSATTLPTLGLFNKWNNDIINDYKKYVNEVNVFTDASNIPHVRHTGYGKGRHLHIWGERTKDKTVNIQYFPSITKLIEQVDLDPNIQTTAVFAAIFDGKGRVNIHTDVDTEFVIVQEKGKLFERRVRQHRAHIAILIPDDCFFYHISDKVRKIHWEVGNSFSFEKFDKHYTVNNSNFTRVILEYDFWEAVE